MARKRQTEQSHTATEETALLRAIDADPDDDAVRLVYADWLEDHGNPRADAVRLRCRQIGRIKEKLPRLKAADVRFSYWAAHGHRYQLLPPLPASTIRAIEGRYGVQIPEDYFDFVTRVAEAGAGPSYGIESIQKHCYDGMATPFPFTGTADLEAGYDFAGAAGYILLAQHGCASDAYLVVSGSEAGKVWELWGGGDGMWHATGMTFLAWYEAWLDEGLGAAAGGRGHPLWRPEGW